MFLFKRKGLCVGAVLALGACGYGDPYAYDWDRERLSAVPSSYPEVSLCFDRTSHAQEQIETLAHQQCQVKVKEIETLRLNQQAQGARFSSQAEGALFEGPLARAQQIEAILKTVTPQYKQNDVLICSVMMPNRVTYTCLYDSNAQPESRPVEATPVPSDLTAPDALPVDLEP